MKRVSRSTKAFGMGLVVVLVLAACEEASFSYSNPLDPEVDASVSDVLDRVEDPDLRRAIVESAGGDTSVSKRELHWVHAPSWDGYDINSLQGLEFFPNVEGLELYGASGMTAEDFAVLGQLSMLNGLVLGGAALNDQDLIQLGTSLGEGIDWIQLRENEITIEGVQALASATGLDSIDISGTDRTDGNNDPGYRLTRGATVFDEFAAAGLTEQIGGVSFVHFGLTDADLTGLSRFPRLWSIGLGHNRIDSVATINNYLLNVNKQEEAVYLNLGDNPISENELAGLNLQNVRHLDIWSMVGAAGPGTALTNVPPFENPGSRLKDLNMDSNQSITSISNLGGLLRSVPLEALHLGASSITSVDEIMTQRDDGTIAAQNLRRVYLNNIDVPGEPLRGVAALVDLPALEELILHDTILADDETVRTAFNERTDIFVEYPDGTTNQPPPPPQE